MSDLARDFLARSRAYLTGEYLPKIRASLAHLPSEDIWWRPNASSNSIGHLMLHLAGNLRQWIVSSLGGAPDMRVREREFDPDVQPPPQELLDRLSAVVAEADAVLARLDAATLAERRTIQGQDVTGLEAVYHAVEHFGMHTGQIAYVAKLRSGADLGFYEVDAEGRARPRWSPPPAEES